MHVRLKVLHGSSAGKELKISGPRFLIGNNRGGTNGWVGASAVHGIATEIDNSGC